MVVPLFEKYARLFEKYARLFEKYARLFSKKWHFMEISANAKKLCYVCYIA